MTNMAIIKTAELTGNALDWAVGKADAEEMRIIRGKIETLWTDKGYNPGTNWAHGGPIIEREGITTVFCSGGLGESRNYWAATNETQCWHWGYGPYHEQDNEKSIQIYRNVIYTGKTPLIAAMRCYVASKLGDNVEVPSELL